MFVVLRQAVRGGKARWVAVACVTPVCGFSSDREQCLLFLVTKFDMPQLIPGFVAVAL